MTSGAKDEEGKTRRMSNEKRKHKEINWKITTNMDIGNKKIDKTKQNEKKKYALEKLTTTNRKFNKTTK